MKIMPFLLKLIVSAIKMAEGAKQDVHWWKLYILSGYSFIRRGLSLI